MSQIELSQKKELEEETYVEDPLVLYGVRNATLFLIDATPPMFQNDPQNDESYFLQCIKQYKEIIRQKLAWNSKDWIGLMLFGTNEWDMNPEVKNVLTVQKINIPSVDRMKEILKIENEDWKHYRDVASYTSYPLHDALWHAAQSFYDIKLPMPVKKVILFTCRDDPPISDQNERHRIRVKATDYNDIHLQLSVVGLGEHWNHEDFYKDLEMLSAKIDAEDYKRTSLKDLLEQIKLPSRIMAKLPLRLGKDVTLDVTLRNFTVPNEYLKSVTISKEHNIPLMKCTYRKGVADDFQEEGDGDRSRPESPILEMDVKKYQEFGQKKICLSLEEVRHLGVQNTGINLICAKPICYHPLYHSKSPYFMTYFKTSCKDNKLLFASLLDRCTSREIMLICSVTLREYSRPKLCCMIPNSNSGGFYLYRIPFAECVRDNTHLDKFKYTDENKPPIDPEESNLLTKIIRKMRIKYDPRKFPNPKLQVQRQTIETLALDLEQSEPLTDHTLPDTDAMEEVAGSLLDAYYKILNEQELQGEGGRAGPSAKKLKKNNEPPAYDIDSLVKVIKSEKLTIFTVPELKEVLKYYSLSTKGRKEELITRITNFVMSTGSNRRT